MGKGPVAVAAPQADGAGLGLRSYYKGKIEELEMLVKDRSHNLRRLEAQRNELNTQGAQQMLHDMIWLPCWPPRGSGQLLL